MKKALAIVAGVAASMAVGMAMMGAAGQPEQRQAQSPASVSQGVKAELGSLAFLKGTWSGTIGQDWVEETWSGAHGDSIVGMFRWQGGGKVTTMWELLSIKDEGGVPVLRLRHFDGKFDPWKSEMGPVDAMPASVVSANRVVFTAGVDSKGGLKSVEYKCPAADVLEITVSFKDEKRAAIEMDLKKE